MLTFGISLILFGCVSGNKFEEITLDNPVEADKSLTETVASLYAGSFYLVLSGCGLITIIISVLFLLLQLVYAINFLLF